MKKSTIYTLIIAVFITLFLSFQNRFFEIAKQIEIYNGLFKQLNMTYINEINPGDLTDKAIKNTLKNLDPYTQFYNEQDVEDVRIRREGEYGGIGISSYYAKNGITIADVYKGFPADKAGLKMGDVIISVNKQNLVGLENEQLSTMLKGIPNKKLELEVLRNGKKQNFSLALDRIEVNPVPFYKMVDATTGYMVLTRFNDKASADVKDAFEFLKDEGMQQLILDLRGNPGGSLLEAIRICNFFLPKGSKIVSTKGKTRKLSNTYVARNNPLDLKIPVVVLIDDRSASASEIVSGALQDYDRAVVIGQRSFGKGLVQRYYPLTYGTQMKVTISKYYTPSGRCIQELDYANRDPKTGKVPKFSDGVVNTFTTKNGRIVKDGGGVMPDILIKSSKKNEDTKSLIISRAIFNFGTDFYHQNKNLDTKKFIVSKAVFNDFKDYLLQKDTTFLSNSQRLFKNAYRNSSASKTITNDYYKLYKKLNQQKVANISLNRDIIQQKLLDNILQRYEYKEGVYTYKIKNDEAIKTASILLKNTTKYHGILKGNN